MASQPASSSTAPLRTRDAWSHLPAETTPFGRLGQALSKRRIPLTIGMTFLLFGVNFFIRGLRPRDLLDCQDWRAMLGIALILSGLSIRSWAAGTLHKIKALTTTGPYQHMRNPLYFGSFLMMLGFCAVMWDVITLAVLIIPMLVVYFMAIRREEQLMAAIFPDTWPDYAARTPRFVPYIPGIPRLTGWSLDQWRSNREYQAVLGSALFCGLLIVWHFWPK
jgi:protein-S-isoprenylcysteine O-methyltransferase Ste14